jgi:hypothetical protein
LINSYLGNNATISCCEVLNSLIFPAHEQHHNNSFLCAALVMGQSNIPAGATIGSNHNSRAADGEIVAGRGFWPGLCVSLKHNSKFASFTMIVKGDYLFELNIPFPFALISLNYKDDQLEIMPAYWFMYNMYALARNAWKYTDRDSREEKIQLLEYDYLAPDSINEMFESLRLLELFTGKAWFRKNNFANVNDNDSIAKGKALLLEKNAVIHELEIIAEGFENSKRKTIVRRVQQSYNAYKEMIFYYGLLHLIKWIEENEVPSTERLIKELSSLNVRLQWLNVGGQLIPVEEVNALKDAIKNSQVNSWDELHNAYTLQGEKYLSQKMQHALISLFEVEAINASDINAAQLNNWLDKAVEITTSITHRISESRKKDYTNPFRKMIYDSQAEMNDVLGEFDKNSFVKHQQKELEQFKKRVEKIKTTQLGLSTLQHHA